MRILTVNAGPLSLRLVHVEDGRPGARLDVAQAPGRADGDVREFVEAHPAPEAVGHRLVHGGRRVLRPTVADGRLRVTLEEVAGLAPLHVPPALTVLDQLHFLLPDVPHVLCPDTTFHARLPAHAATFPERRPPSGAHGLSHAYATRRAAELLGRPAGDLHLVLAHLGDGDSVCAVRDGRSVDMSAGFTPRDGVPMTTRSGDPRALVVAAGRGDRAARLASQIYAYRVRREIAAVATALDRVDALVFTGDVGWDQPEVRHDICAGLRPLGIGPPPTGNRLDDGPVTGWDARTQILLVQPREEIQIARDAAAALSRHTGD